MLIKVLISITLAIIAGIITGPHMGFFDVTFLQVYGLIGQLFLNALMLVVVPLVVSSIITGTARMGTEGTFKTLGVKTIGFFLANSFLAILVGMFLTLLIHPGALSHDLSSLVTSTDTSNLAALKAQSQGTTFDKFEQIFLKLVPSNILAAASQGQMLGLITFSLVFGYFTSNIESKSSAIIISFWNGIFEIMMKITHLVMKALPIGVFGLVAKVVATTGMSSLKPLALFTGTVILGLLVHSLVVWSFLLKTIGKVNPWNHLKAMSPALLTAFSTSSSVATLPLSIECLETRANVSNRITSFTIPLGTSMNCAGSSLHVIVASLFICQVYGVDLSLSNLFVILLLTLFSSIGTAGIPSACLVTVLLILHTLGLPADALGIILAVERFLDMCRSTANVYGNSCVAVLVQNTEKKKELIPEPLMAQN